MDIGAVQGWKRGRVRKRETGVTGTWRGTPRAKKDLVRRPRTAREGSIGMSSGGHQVKVTYRWTDAPRPGELVGRSVCNR